MSYKSVWSGWQDSNLRVSWSQTKRITNFPTPRSLYRWPDSNRHGPFGPRDFKSLVATITPHRQLYLSNMSKNFFFVNRAGVEPTTYALEVRCSIQLSYRSLFLTLQRYEINLVFTSFIFHLRKFIWWTWRDSNPRPDKETKSLIHKLSLFFLTNKIDTLLHCSIINVQLDLRFSCFHLSSHSFYRPTMSAGRVTLLQRTQHLRMP
jgi:hypothetical protein